MAIKLGSAYGKVSIDSSGVKSGVDNAVNSMGKLEKSAQKLGGVLQNVGKVMTASVTIPLALMAKEAVMMASSYQENLNKVNVVFEDNGEVIENWSKDAAKNMGMSQAAALAAAGTYGNLFTAQGMGTKAAADMSMALVQLSADMASFNDASPEEVLLALRSGLSGEIEPLKRFGVALNETLMKSKAMEMGLGSNIQALTEAQKIQIRYAIIMDQTAKAQGDFARTSESLANQLRILKGNWGDTLKILGDNLLPIVEKLLIQLNKWLEWFNNADPKTQKFIANLLLIAFVAGPLLIIFGKLLPLAFSGATKSLNPFSGGIFGLIANFVKWIGVAAMVVKVLTALGVATGPIGVGILAVQGAIAGVGASLAAVLLPILLIIATLALLYWAFKNNVGGITTTVTQLWFIIKYYFGLMKDWMVNAFMKVNWGTIGKYIIFGIANGLLLGIPGLVLAAANAAKSVLSTFDKELDMHSPSKAMFKRGIWSGQGFTGGLEQSVKPDAVAKMLARPTSGGNSSSQQNINMNFANGLTIRQVREMIANNNEKLLSDLSSAFGGA